MAPQAVLKIDKEVKEKAPRIVQTREARNQETKKCKAP